MRSILRTIVILTLLLSGGIAARSETITFDNLRGNYGPLPAGYGGFTWTNINFVNGTYVTDVDGPNGYANDTASPPNVAYDVNGTGGSFSSVQAFTLDSLCLGSAWNDDENITITGYNFGGILYSTTISGDSDGTAHVDLDWPLLTKVTISGAGGINSGYDGAGEQFVLDNVTINSPDLDPIDSTPEPSSLILLGTGALSLAGAARRKLRKA